MEPREMEAREASAGDRRAIADADQADSLIFLLLNRRQMLREWHTTRHMFHSEIVSNLCCESWTKFSAQTSCGEQDGGYTAEFQTDYMFIRTKLSHVSHS